MVLGYKPTAAPVHKGEQASSSSSGSTTGSAVDLADDDDDGNLNKDMCVVLLELAEYEFKRNEKFKAIGLKKVRVWFDA